MDVFWALCHGLGRRVGHCSPVAEKEDQRELVKTVCACGRCRVCLVGLRDVPHQNKIHFLLGDVGGLATLTATNNVVAGETKNFQLRKTDHAGCVKRSLESTSEARRGGAATTRTQPPPKRHVVLSDFGSDLGALATEPGAKS